MKSTLQTSFATNTHALTSKCIKSTLTIEKKHLHSTVEIHEMKQLSASHTTAQLQPISQVSQEKIPAVLQGYSTPPFEIKVTDVKVFCQSNKSQWLLLTMLHHVSSNYRVAKFVGPKRC